VLAFLTDENFKVDIVRGLRRQRPELSVVRVQDVGLSGADDEVILERAAQEARLLLTHDVKTVTKYAYGRASAALLMPGVVEVPRWLLQMHCCILSRHKRLHEQADGGNHSNA